MTKYKLKRYNILTAYNIEKTKKMNNFTYLNKTVCKKGQAVIVGDSITELFNMELFDGWRFENDKIVYNRGISGDTSNRLLERFEDNVLYLNPSTVVLLIGINDLSAGATPEYIAENVDEILNKMRVQPYEIKVILQAVYPVNTTMNLNLKRKKIGCKIISQLNVLLKEKAQKYGAYFMNLTDILSDENRMLKKEFTYDGLHPNAQGFAEVAERLIPIMSNN